jgi:pimeloyl-ACP methyl ester carboxylesterase
MRRLAIPVTGLLLLGSCSLEDPGSAQDDGLGELAAQTISWEACEDQEQAELGVECATVEVPLDYEDPDGERIDIAIARRPADDPASRRGVLFTNPGGPGAEGRSMASVLAHQPAGEVYDTIGMDPRGVGGSTQLLCDPLEEVDRPDRPGSEAELDLYAEAAEAEESACAAGGGDLRRHITNMNTARDIDLVRRMLEEEVISFLGRGYGTFLGPLYGEMFPGHLERTVLDSAIDPTATWREQEEAGVAATEENVAAWQAWVAERNPTFQLGTEPNQVATVLDRFAARLADEPIGDIADVGTFDRAVGTATRYRSMWANLAWELGDLMPALDGNPVDNESARQLALLGEPPADEDDESPNGTYQAVTCDWRWPEDPADYYPDMEQVAEDGPYGDSVARVAPSNCTFTSDRDPMTGVGERNYPVGLVVAATGDTQTAYSGGVGLADYLGLHLVTVVDSGIHGHFGEGDACIDDAVNAYLVDGTLPAVRTDCPTTRDVIPDIPTGEAVRKEDVNPSLEEINARIAGTT